jgi:hypothetical protein
MAKSKPKVKEAHCSIRKTHEYVCSHGPKVHAKYSIYLE